MVVTGGIAQGCHLIGLAADMCVGSHVGHAACMYACVLPDVCPVHAATCPTPSVIQITVYSGLGIKPRSDPVVGRAAGQPTIFQSQVFKSAVVHS